jgi:hypothetical protein
MSIDEISLDKPLLPFESCQYEMVDDVHRRATRFVSSTSQVQMTHWRKTKTKEKAIESMFFVAVGWTMSVRNVSTVLFSSLAHVDDVTMTCDQMNTYV